MKQTKNRYFAANLTAGTLIVSTLMMTRVQASDLYDPGTCLETSHLVSAINHK